MSKVDWSLAPEGYPLWLDDLNKCVGGDMSGWHRDDGDRYTDEKGLHWFKHNAEDYTVYHRPTPQPKPWSGPEDGLPPVNTVCDLRMKDGGWGDAVIKYISATQCVWLWLNGNPDQREWSSEPWKMDFRPIRTAAEKRETAIRELMDIAQVDCRVTAARLVDAGFKREACKSDCSTNNRGVPELLGPCDCR